MNRTGLLGRLQRFILRLHYRARTRWEYVTFNTTDMRDIQQWGDAGWEIIAIGWGKSPTNYYAKRRKAFFAPIMLYPLDDED